MRLILAGCRCTRRPPQPTLDAEQAATLDRRLAAHQGLGPWLGV
jgi:hypothetical protein